MFNKKSGSAGRHSKGNKPANVNNQIEYNQAPAEASEAYDEYADSAYRNGDAVRDSEGSFFQDQDNAGGFQYENPVIAEGDYGNAPIDMIASSAPVTFQGKPGSRKRKKAMKNADKIAVNTYSRDNGTYNKKDRKVKGKGKKVLLGIFLFLLVALVAVGVGIFKYVQGLERAMQQADDEQQTALIKDALAPAMNDEPFYMVLLGTDQRKGQTVGRSDTCIVTRVDPKEAVITMISIPRDTAIRYKGSVVKFNAAYVYDGPAGSITAASELMGVDISHYAQVNFKGLADVIDAIGGVDVDVPVAINDSHAGYVTIDEGRQHLNGRQALVFARSRAYATGDFQRSTNQRTLAKAAIKKVLSLPPTKVPNVITKAANSISTDFSVVDLIGLATLFQDADKVKIYSASVPSSTAMVDGVSYVVCDTASLSEMMRLCNEGKDPSAAATDGTVTSSKAAKKKGMTTIYK